MNLRPSGYEPDELPGCSTPRRVVVGLRPRGRGDLVAGGGDEGRGWSVDLAATYSPTSWDAVPWALRGFTAEFGMGSGGAPALSATRSTDHPLCPHPGGRGAGGGGWASPGMGGRSRVGGCGCRWRGSRSIGRLGPVSCTRRRASTPGLSTWWSTTALMARPGFAVGFPLRCLQRLSCPNLATRLRGWRHDRSTRGSSTPVLSY